MLRLVILVWQLKYTIPTTKQYGPSYWKTTSVTDKVMDYWNHGPVFIPGLEDVYGISTKVNDIVPAWLTKRTRFITLTELTTEHTGTLTSSPAKTTLLTTKATQSTEKATSQKAKPPINQTTTDNKRAKKILTNATRRPKKTKQQSSFEEENDSQKDQRDPFSAFMTRLFKVLSDRTPWELPAFFKPFISYMTELITDGDLKELGGTAVAYFEKVTDELNKTLSNPDNLQTLCYEAYDMLMNRHDANDARIDENTNELLSFLDDMYNEAEEEVMHFVLREVKEFPYSNITAEQIAYMFVNIVFLTPMNRISGTPIKDILVKKLTAAIAKRNTSLRRHIDNSYREKKSRSDLLDKIKLKKDMRRFTESNYKAIRENMENINNLIDKLKVGISSSDTSAYEYSEDDDEADNVKVEQAETRMKKTKNNEIQILRTNDEESLLENDEYNKTMDYGQINKVTPNINDIIQDLQGLIRVPDKSHVIPKESSINFRFDHIEKYLNNEPTVLVPNHLLTKLIKHRVPNDRIPESSRKKPIPTRYAYFNDARLRLITKPTKKVVHKVPTSREVEMKTHFHKLPPIDQPSNYPVQDTPGFKNKHIVSIIPLKRRPAYLDKRLETIQSLNVNMLKPFSSQVTKYTPKTIKTVKSLRNGKIKSSRMQNTLKSTTKHSINLDESLENYLIALEPFGKQVTKHTPVTEITTKIVKSIRNRKIRFSRVQNTLKNATKHKNVNHEQYIDLKEENAYESDYSDMYAEYSSEPLGRKPLNQRKSKYEKLKRKYNLLKRLNEQILARNATIIKHKRTSPEVIQKLRGKVDENIKTKTKVSEEIYNQKHSKTPANAHRKIRMNNINLFLDDYDGKIEFESDSQETFPQASKSNDYTDIIRKSFPLSKTTNNNANTAIEFNDAEKELINYNASRRIDDGKLIGGRDSHETDVEAVLKTNIYKAFKKLLKS